MLKKVFYLKEIGEYLKNARLENGISILEASEDLKIESAVIENIEEGNIRAFKDMFALKELVKDYAKYLGLDANYIMEEFNDFLFCHTSKISLEEIKELNKKQEEKEEKKVTSPYTNIPKEKRDYKPLLKLLSIAVIIFIILLIVFNIINKERTIDTELKGSINYEFTY